MVFRRAHSVAVCISVSNFLPPTQCGAYYPARLWNVLAASAGGTEAASLYLRQVEILSPRLRGLPRQLETLISKLSNDMFPFAVAINAPAGFKVRLLDFPPPRQFVLGKHRWRVVPRSASLT
jgi:hypothetical protein